MAADSRPVVEVRDAIIARIATVDPPRWTRDSIRGGGVAELSTRELAKTIRARLLRRDSRP